jgi:hypothetical protein
MIMSFLQIFKEDLDTIDGSLCKSTVPVLSHSRERFISFVRYTSTSITDLLLGNKWDIHWYLLLFAKFCVLKTSVRRILRTWIIAVVDVDLGVELGR